MDGLILEWLNLLVRWAHIILGIAWIGTSFFFVALDFSLRRTPEDDPGLAGASWHVHGGGFYRMEKFLVAPKDLPKQLIWYRYEAYLTWLTGFLMLILVYYLKAETFLIDPEVKAWLPQQAIFISIASLAVGWWVYDKLLCRSFIGDNLTWLALSTFALVLFASWFYSFVFSGRGALIHVGALIGTLMAFNVFAVIIPNQKKITASLLNGEAPDPKLGQIGKQRSLHNTYFTLPVLVMMISGHYPFLTSYQPLWLLVALIIVGGAAVRHFFVKHEAHAELSTYWWTVPIAAVALILAFGLTYHKQVKQTALGDVVATGVSDLQALQIVEKHCLACHVAQPTHESFDAPPKGIVLQNVSDLQKHKDGVKAQSVLGNAMPIGNETGMTQEERQLLGLWLEQQ